MSMEHGRLGQNRPFVKKALFSSDQKDLCHDYNDDLDHGRRFREPSRQGGCSRVLTLARGGHFRRLNEDGSRAPPGDFLLRRGRRRRHLSLPCDAPLGHVESAAAALRGAVSGGAAKWQLHGGARAHCSGNAHARRLL